MPVIIKRRSGAKEARPGDTFHWSRGLKSIDIYQYIDTVGGMTRKVAGISYEDSDDPVVEVYLAEFDKTLQVIERDPKTGRWRKHKPA